MKVVVFFISLFMSLNVNASIDNKKDIESILSEFSQAVSDKKKEQFLSLFYSDKVIWLVVVPDKDLKEKDEKVNLHDQNGFIDWVVSDKQSKEVRFSNIHIMTDGDVASVFCDYTFYLDNKATNYGKETFTFVRTKSGWKILAIAFSSNLAKQ